MNHIDLVFGVCVAVQEEAGKRWGEVQRTALAAAAEELAAFDKKTPQSKLDDAGDKPNQHVLLSHA